jgi:hypothetical protein
VASVVSGVEGGVVVVIVSPVVASEVATGPGVGSSAELTVLKATPTAPMAMAALAPTAAETSLSCVVFTSDYSFVSWYGPTVAGLEITREAFIGSLSVR